MRKTEFIATLKAEAQKMGTVVVDTIERADHSYKGLMLKAKSGVPTPVVNLDSLYEAYKNGMELSECIETMTGILNMKPDTPIDPSEITDWDKAKNKLYLRTFGSVADEENTVYEKKEDIYLIPYLQVSSNGSQVVRVTKKLLDLWEVSEDEVIEYARENQETLRPAKIYNMGERFGFPGELPLYIVTTTNEAFGASAIFYEDMEEKIREKLGDDFYILPSSVHEVIVVAKSFGNDVEALVEMVTTINGSSVDEPDRLTNSVYTFEDNEFRKVG